MSLELSRFDPATFLTDDDSIVEYLTIAFESNDPKNVIKALRVVARARGGVGQRANEIWVDVENLARILDNNPAPEFATVLKVMHALGVKLSASMVA